MSETYVEQLSRVGLMADDDNETWDLSPNDKAAITAILQRLAALTAERDEAQRVAAFARLFQQAARDESLSDLEARNVPRFLSLNPITEREIARGKELAERYGWK